MRRIGGRNRPLPTPARLLAAALLAAPVGGCAGGAAEGRWVGQIRPEPGSLAAPGCRGQDRGTLVVRGDKVLFTPGDGTAVLTGTAAPDGKIRADLSRLGVDHKPYVLRFEGATANGEVSGTYAAPGCRASVTLRPVA